MMLNVAKDKILFCCTLELHQPENAK